MAVLDTTSGIVYVKGGTLSLTSATITTLTTTTLNVAGTLTFVGGTVLNGTATANRVKFSNAGNATRVEVYGLDTDASNYSRTVIENNNSTGSIGVWAEKAGAGNYNTFSFGSAGSNWSVTSAGVLAPSTAGNLFDLGTTTTPINIGYFGRTDTGYGTTSTDGIVIQSALAATGGVPVQISPRTRWVGTAWDTSASQTVAFFAETLPATAATPTGTLKFGYSLNGAAASYPMTVSSAGALTTLNYASFGTNPATGSGMIRLPNGIDNGIIHRNAANNADVGKVGVDTSDHLHLQNGVNGIIRVESVLDVDAQYRLGTGTAKMFVHATAPTIASGFGTSPSVAASNGTAAFTINVGTGGSASSGVITLPAATTGWALSCINLTNSAIAITAQTASTTTSATIANYSRTTGLLTAWTASDVISIQATAY